MRLKVPESFSRLFLGGAGAAHDWQARATREPRVGSDAVRPRRGENAVFGPSTACVLQRWPENTLAASTVCTLFFPRSAGLLKHTSGMDSFRWGLRCGLVRPLGGHARRSLGQVGAADRFRGSSCQLFLSTVRDRLGPYGHHQPAQCRPRDGVPTCVSTERSWRRMPQCSSLVGSVYRKNGKIALEHFAISQAQQDAQVGHPGATAPPSSDLRRMTTMLTTIRPDLTLVGGLSSISLPVCTWR